VTGFSGAMATLTQFTTDADTSHGEECRTLAWFAIQTRPRYEKKVVERLRQKSISAYLPLFTEKHQWSDRSRAIHMPLFPSYVFVRIEEALPTRTTVLRTNGVTGFVGVRGSGVPIPDHQISSIQAILENGVPFSPRPFLSKGQRVRIHGGSLNGVEGILVAENDDQSLVVSVQLIQRSLSIRVAGYAVRPA
jgi:transcription antitermination factor NusG